MNVSNGIIRMNIKTKNLLSDETFWTYSGIVAVCIVGIAAYVYIAIRLKRWRQLDVYTIAALSSLIFLFSINIFQRAMLYFNASTYADFLMNWVWPKRAWPLFFSLVAMISHRVYAAYRYFKYLNGSKINKQEDIERMK